jgi:hypothetical protein
MLNQSLTTFSLPPRPLSHVQQVVALNSCSIVIKFPSDEVLLTDEDAVAFNHVSFVKFPDLYTCFTLP